MKTKDTASELKEMIEKHKGKRVVTGWNGMISWHWVGFKKGVRGTIESWHSDGPGILVDDRQEDFHGTVLFPGGNSSNKWGEGRTWKFE